MRTFKVSYRCYHIRKLKLINLRAKDQQFQPEDASFFSRVHELNEKRTVALSTQIRGGYLVEKKRQRRATVSFGETVPADDRYTRTKVEQKHERDHAEQRYRTYCEELVLQRLRSGPGLPKSIQDDLGWCEEGIQIIFEMEEEEAETEGDCEKVPKEQERVVDYAVQRIIQLADILLTFFGLGWLLEMAK